MYSAYVFKHKDLFVLHIGEQQDPNLCGGLQLPYLDLHGGLFTVQHHLHHQPRHKRLRTSFKHHQLRIMKNYFVLNHNPDAKDLNQLSQKSGLGKRILQVGL